VVVLLARLPDTPTAALCRLGLTPIGSDTILGPATSLVCGAEQAPPRFFQGEIDRDPCSSASSYPQSRSSQPSAHPRIPPLSSERSRAETPVNRVERSQPFSVRVEAYDYKKGR